MVKNTKQVIQDLDGEIKEALKNWKSIVKKYQKPSTKKAVVQLVNSFLPFLGLWVLMYFSLSWSYWITLGLAAINCFFLVRIFIIQHDCGHQSFFKKTSWNNAVGFICSFFSSIPYNYWSRVHSFHHGHVGQLDFRDIGDINFLTVEEFRELSLWGRFKYRIFRNPIVLFFIVPMIYMGVMLRYPSINFQGWKNVTQKQLINNTAMLAVYIILGFLIGWKAFLMIQIPIIWFFGVVSFWFFYVQHQHEEGYMRWKDNWDYVLAAIKGSSYYKLPRLFQWLTGNIGFHHIHHLNSRIPNYQLAKCAKENPILQKYTTILTFRDSLKMMFHKLWDEQSNRMISFREFYRMERVRVSA
ncbi:MAG: fatty acid desaturase [Bacteroidota bacterium]